MKYVDSVIYQAVHPDSYDYDKSLIKFLQIKMEIGYRNTTLFKKLSGDYNEWGGMYKCTSHLGNKDFLLLYIW